MTFWKRRRSREFDNALDSIQKLVFSIGGYFQGYETRTYTVSGEKVALEIAHSLRMERNRPENYCPFTKEEFIAELKEIHIGEWKKSYCNKRVLDGTDWGLEIYFNGDHEPVEFSGSNAYPPNFGKLESFLRNDPYTVTIDLLKDFIKNRILTDREIMPGIDQKTITYANGDIYEGDMEDDVKEGKGKYTWGEETDWAGDSYIGEWKNDLREGRGIYTFANGSIYDGEWKDNMRSGQGTMIYANGDMYEGLWKDSKRDGQGTITYANGDIYEGDWKNDVKEGKGKYTWGEETGWAGDSYIGEWKNDLREGRGIYTFASGDVCEGEFKDGAFIG